MSNYNEDDFMDKLNQQPDEQNIQQRKMLSSTADFHAYYFNELIVRGLTRQEALALTVEVIRSATSYNKP